MVGGYFRGGRDIIYSGYQKRDFFFFGGKSNISVDPAKVLMTFTSTDQE